MKNAIEGQGACGLLPGRKVCMRDMDLSGMDFSGWDLTGWDFTGAKLCGAAFRDCDLAYTVFDRCDLTGADFARAAMLQTRLREAYCENTLFDRALLWKVDLSLGWFIRCDFRHVTFGHVTALATKFGACRFDAAPMTTGLHVVKPRKWRGRVPSIPFTPAAEVA